VRRCKVDVVILEPHLPGVNGLELIRTIHQWQPEVEILILTACTLPGAVRAAFKAGARGFALKSEEPIQIIRAVRKVSEHTSYVTPQIAQANSYSYRQLSNRETAVLKLLTSGLRNKDIASVLGISRRTVEAYRGHVSQKYHCHSFGDLIRFGLQHEMAEDFEPGLAALPRAKAPGSFQTLELTPHGPLPRTASSPTIPFP